MAARPELAPAIAALLLVACAGTDARRAEPLPERAWSVSGRWFETCTCTIPCPCWSGAGAPTMGSCSVLHAFHVEQGYYGNLTLDGVWVVVVGRTAEGETCAASRSAADFAFGRLYVDDLVSADALAPIERIFSRLVLGGLHGRALAIERCRNLTAFATDTGAGIVVPGLLRAEVFAPAGEDGEPSHFALGSQKLPWIVPPVREAKSILFRFRRDGLEWHVLGRHALVGRFAWSSASGALPWEGQAGS